MCCGQESCRGSYIHTMTITSLLHITIIYCMLTFFSADFHCVRQFRPCVSRVCKSDYTVPFYVVVSPVNLSSWCCNLKHMNAAFTEHALRDRHWSVAIRDAGFREVACITCVSRYAHRQMSLHIQQHKTWYYIYIYIYILRKTQDNGANWDK
jgi:hypothetical protein